MHENIQVQCSGAFYSSLHCEIIHNGGIQEGFFKGEIEKHTSFDINDSDLNSENAVIKINISGYIPCATVGSFYNGCGKINPSYIEYLTDNVEDIVGWYRCRRCTNGSFLKEIKVHEQLCELFSSKGKYFLFALLTRNDETPSSKMDVSYKFQILSNSNSEFSSIPLNIINLNNTSASGYIKAAASTLYNSEALEKILLKIPNLEPGVEEVESIHMGLIRQVQSLLPQFASVQERHRHALQRVNHLRECCHNYELKLGEDHDMKSIMNDKDDSCSLRCEKDLVKKMGNKSEGKLSSNTKEVEDSCIEKSMSLNDDENEKKISKLSDVKICNKTSKDRSSQKANIESLCKDSKEEDKDFNKKELSNISENLPKEILKDSSVKEMKLSSLESRCKGNKNETNINIAMKTTSNSTILEETKSTEENKQCSDSPEF